MSGQPPAVALLHGGDGQLLDDALAAVSHGLFREPSAGVFDREVLDGRETTVASIVQSAMTLPVAAPVRLVAVRHCQALSAKGSEILAEYGSNPNPGTCLLLLADDALTASRDRKDHWLLGAVPSGAVIALPTRQGGALEQWLRRRAAVEGLTVSEEAAHLLVQWVGDDGAALLGEVRKAALAGGPQNQAVGVKDVTAVVGERRVSGVFDLTRAVERHDVALAVRTLESLFATEEPVLLLALLTREVRTAWTIQEWARRGQSVEQIARTLRRPVPVVQAYAARSTGASETAPARLRKCWEAERRLKSGGDARAELTALVVALLVLGAAAVSGAAPCASCVVAGAATVSLVPPGGAPLAGYGSLARRLLFPDVLGIHPYVFWFKPSQGTLDPLFARALVVESRGTRVAWATVDLVAVDRSFTQEVAEKLRATGLPPAGLIISASHTHSGPGAFSHSAFWAFLAVDRLNAAVRSILVTAVVEAITRAEAAKVPARIAAFALQGPDVTTGRLGLPVDREILGLKLVASDGQPLALVWNYAIHGTMLGPGNLSFSGDVMGAASEILERELHAPVLFVNGAVGDVSPRRHGPAAVREVGTELASIIREGWRQSQEVRAVPVALRSTRVRLHAPFVSLRNCLGRLVPRGLTVPLSWAMPTDAELSAIALGDVVWVVFPGELQSALGRQIKEAAARARFAFGFVAGVSNDYLGYFVTAGAYEIPGYVACGNLYGAAAGERFTKAAGGLIQGLGEGRDAAGR